MLTNKLTNKLANNTTSSLTSRLRLGLGLVGAAAVGAVLAVMAATGDAEPSGERYGPSVDAMADVDAALARAQARDALALIVLGANWCHDSRALASRVQRSPLKEIIEQHYETVFVDVGYYEHGQRVVQRFGVPIYYATPTVLIVDPTTETLVNADNRHQWSGAHDISMDESVDYFSMMAASSRIASPPAAEVDAQIKAIERQLAEQVVAGYAHVGPLLKAYKEGSESDTFEDAWNELRDFRSAIPEDLEQLREEATERLARGETNITVTPPEYPPFSWQRSD